ncbi:MAG: FAD-dependent oxidoreductase [Deltaproteobacteria bacterium]|nr:FAD-dependent oxidoreductase [Deltaproteobacteria bacterium]
MTDAELKTELEKCEYCELKPCREACPTHCSPADFIMAARLGEPSDYQRAAALILSKNPLGGTCGAVCPDTHCMAACVKKKIDHPIQIPAIQAGIILRAARLGKRPVFELPVKNNGKKVAIVGAGAAGLVAAHTLAHMGYAVEIFEQNAKAGGALCQIPTARLSPEILKHDLDFILQSPLITLRLNTPAKPGKQLAGFDAVLVTCGLTRPISLGIPGEKAAITGFDYLSAPERYPLAGPVAVVGGGAVAVDCAVTARRRGAAQVEMFTLEALSELPLTDHERHELVLNGVQMSGRTKLVKILGGAKGVTGIEVVHVTYPAGDVTAAEVRPGPFDPRAVVPVRGSKQRRSDFKHVIVAIGHRSAISKKKGWYFAGDCDHGPSTVVEAAAAGKNVAMEIHAALSGMPYAPPASKRKSTVLIEGYRHLPVALDADFFGRKILSPFLLSAAPPTDGYAQMRRAFEAGWAGGIMKTAFDNVPIHIPAEYMFTFGKTTWGNCDNVSGHALDRVCREVGDLRREFPDRLVMASTGGPVTGNDDQDAAGWVGNTRKLEAAGVMGIEYSLSCPQGGDGTEGDIVSQNAELTVKIIEWILKASSPEIPKLFKLTAAVTAIPMIVIPIRKLLDRYPRHKAGITLANTFPALGFRSAPGKRWDEGVIVGMSGEGVTPISNMTLAKVAHLGVPVSGNGGPMDYRAAAHFLALGAQTVQFCTVAMKHGVGVIDELHQGLSHLMQARGIRSVADLIGIALPKPVTDFMELPAKKPISAVYGELCVGCGNCSRCSYHAISVEPKEYPRIDPERCVGCSICTKKCPSGALYMRVRSPQELAALRES